MQKIYLDNAATTQPLAECNDIYLKYAQELWQNPSALYADATRVQKEEDDAKAVLPVSYTHLDVYKRQCPGSACGIERKGLHDDSNDAYRRVESVCKRTRRL